MAFNVRQMPADRAAALIGEDDVAVFSQRLETMAATSQFDLEEPDSTRLTFLFEVGKDDLLREGNWLDGVDYMSDLVFETPRDLAGKIFKRFESFADDDHTPSEALAVLEQERIEAELQRQREQAQRDEAEAAAIEEGVEEERATEREHERAAVADDEAREAARVAELRRQGLICEDSAAHNAATASPNGVALGVPGDIAEAARCSAAASARDEGAGGEKHKAGM